jgi:hypothetical protein
MIPGRCTVYVNSGRLKDDIRTLLADRCSAEGLDETREVRGSAGHFSRRRGLDRRPATDWRLWTTRRETLGHYTDGRSIIT